MRHVLIINHNAGSIHHGPNFRSYYVARALIKRGVDVTIVSSSFSHKLNKLPRVKDKYHRENLDGINMIWLKTPKYKSNIERLWNYICFAYRLRVLHDLIPGSVDTVICSSPPPFWIWLSRRLANKFNAKLIFESRDLWPDVILETKRTAFLNPVVWVMIFAERYAYKNSDIVVAVNSGVQSTMEKRGLGKGKFRAIQNGVVLDSTDQSRDLSLQTKEKLPRHECFMVGYAGSLSRVYGLEYFIEAAKQLKDKNVYFILAGTGADEEYLRRKAADLPNVIFVGWVPKKELNSFLQLMDVTYAGLLDYPSFAIGSDSTKVFEYMKACRPVIHALCSKHSVVLESGCGVHIKPEDSASIADAILKLRQCTKSERERMGYLGYRYLQNNRTYDVLGSKWFDII
ncbi:glycosyltransferase family 4 protein [Desulfospira joergensenii]|uniref:glycosyltransferase family 4 protein n=1 Tax=Desulfospira joergensenii TaxID=53329 RepID=UPI0003B48B9E|nr:glycosyltransferase family 4 protein [Desulfospira joergensenii]